MPDSRRLVLAIVGLVVLLSAAGARGQFDPLPASGLFGDGAADATSALTLEAQFTASAAQAPGYLFITATIKPGWHTYSITQVRADVGPLPSKIVLAPSQSYRLTGPFQVDPAPEKKKEKAFDNLLVETHHGTVTWYAPIELSAGVDPATLTIQGRLNVQACDANGCYPPRDYPFSARPGRGVIISRAAPIPSVERAPGETPAAPPPPAEAKHGSELPWRPFTTLAALDQIVGDTTSPVGVAGQAGQAPPTASLAEILSYAVLGFFGGVILNIMPCVLPVIGLKILSFIEQSGHDRRKAFLLNVWYSLGLLSVFAVLASLAAVFGLGWGQLFTYQSFGIVLAAVVFAMGLSFFGVWELPIPGFAGRGKAVELAAQEGATGAFVKGALTTVLATPCSAPFLAPAFAWAVTQPPILIFAVLMAAGLGMASPYLLIGAFPELIRFLPRPGEWMDTFKQVMGFVLLGTVVFILTFLEFSHVIPTVGLLFGLWGACWWIGRVSPLADEAAKARAWIGAVVFTAVIAVLMFPGIDGVLPGRFSFGGLAEVMESRLDREAARRAAMMPVERAPVGASTVLVNVTADWCPTCKTFEATVLNTPAVRQLVERNRVVTLQADWTRGAPEVTRLLEERGGSKQVPTILVFAPGNRTPSAIFGGGYTQQMILDALDKAGPSQ